MYTVFPAKKNHRLAHGDIVSKNYKKKAFTKLSLSDARRLLERGVFETDLKFFPRQCNNILKMR